MIQHFDRVEWGRQKRGEEGRRKGKGGEHGGGGEARLEE